MGNLIRHGHFERPSHPQEGPLRTSSADVIRNLVATSFALDSTLSKGILGYVGNTLPIEIMNSPPMLAPPSGKGVVFMVSGGAVTIYVWDGSAWIAK
jgi:hypothetical protein